MSEVRAVFVVLATSSTSPAPRLVGPHADGVTIQTVEPSRLSGSVRAVVAKGASVVVVESDADAHRALSLGAHEVLRAGDVNESSLVAAIDRARLRAAIQGVARIPLSAELQDAGALSLLSSSMEHHLQSPLGVAAFRCEVLRAAMPPITGLADQYAATAASAGELPASERDHVVAVRAAAPPSVAIHETVDGLALAVRDAARVVERVCTFMSDSPVNEAVDLCAVVRDVASFVSIVVERDAALEVDASSVRYLVEMPRWQLVQSIAALVSNAMQAIEDRGIRGSITLRVVSVADAAVLEVIDDGVGMTPEIQERALEPFFTTRPSPHMGLGLSMVAERVQRAGGDLTLESERGHGTKVSLFFPLVCELEPKVAYSLN